MCRLSLGRLVCIQGATVQPQNVHVWFRGGFAMVHALPHVRKANKHVQAAIAQGMAHVQATREPQHVPLHRSLCLGMPFGCLKICRNCPHLC